jgi:transcriptional regulator with XRE-family HTH domain
VVQVISPSSEVGDAIRAARERRGWSMDDLIAAMGNRIPKQAVHHWEAGRGIGINSLLTVAAAMPEVGGYVIRMVHRAQRAHYLERPGRSPTKGA